MRALTIWRGRIHLLDEVDPWPAQFREYPFTHALQREFVARPSPLDAPRRAGVWSVCQSTGYGEWVAIVGATFTPSKGASRIVEVAVGVTDTLEADLANEVVDGASKVLAEIDRPSGCLRIDRATVHPVDRQPWSYRAAGAALATALCAGLDDETLGARASEMFQRRGK